MTTLETINYYIEQVDKENMDLAAEIYSFIETLEENTRVLFAYKFEELIEKAFNLYQY